MRSPKKLPPWSRHHEAWCAVFFGKPCDCDDKSDRPTPRRRPPLTGGGAPSPRQAKKRERELEDLS